MPLKLTVRKCCCFSVETGTVILGVLDLLNALFWLTACAICLSKLNSDEKSFKDLIKEIIKKNNDNKDVDYNEIANLVVQYLRSMFISTIFNASLIILIVSILLYGIYKRKAVLLLPYMIIKGLNLIGFGIITLLIILSLIFITIVSFFQMLFGIIFVVAMFSLFVYMWIVVYSHYVVLKEENARGQYDKQAYRAT